MTIEGLGKKFQEARMARKLTLDEAARMTKIRPSRLAEIEADDFSQFPSLTYAKGFLQIYGKFLDVDVSPYMEAFEGSEAVTVDGYSYLQDNPAPPPSRAPIVHRRPAASAPRSGAPPSITLFIVGIIVVAVGVMGMKFILNLRRIAPQTAEQKPSPTAIPLTNYYSTQPVATPVPQPTAAPQIASSTAPALTLTVPSPSVTPSPIIAASVAATAAPAPAEPEVRKAVAVAPEEEAKTATKSEGTGPNQIVIKPLKKTYVKVVVDNDKSKPPFERWISPTDGPVEFRGQHFSIRVLDRDAVQIKKNGKSVTEDDTDVTIE